MFIDLNIYILIWVAIVGLCLGSFYNVVILRSISNESIIFPPSKCPKCNHKLYFWHNIPVLSYILLRGKCYFCKEKISIQYPIIELLTMILFCISYLKFGVDIKTLFVIILLSLLLIMTMTDIKERLVDCNLAIAGTVCGILYNLYIGNIINSILGLIIGVLILEAIAWFGYLFTKSRAMGEADTYVAGMLGTCFGIQGLVPLLIYSLIAAMIVILPMFIIKQYKNRNRLNCILMILFVLSLLLFKTVVQNYYTLALLILVALLLSGNILRTIKSDNDKLSYLPFVPAFFIATAYYIFIY